MHFEERFLIGRSPDQVWSFFEDISNLPKWSWGWLRTARVMSASVANEKSATLV